MSMALYNPKKKSWIHSDQACSLVYALRHSNTPLFSISMQLHATQSYHGSFGVPVIRVTGVAQKLDLTPAIVLTHIFCRGGWEGCELGCCIQRACWDCPHQMGHTWCACPEEQPPPIFWCGWWVLGRPQWHHHKLWGLLTLSVWYYVIQFLCIVCFVLYNLYSCECTRIIETTCLYQLAPHVEVYALSPSTWDVSLSSYFLKRESAH